MIWKNLPNNYEQILVILEKNHAYTLSQLYYIDIWPLLYLTPIYTKNKLTKTAHKISGIDFDAVLNGDTKQKIW